MSTIRASVAALLCPSFRELGRAAQANNRLAHAIYGDTLERREMRRLLDAAGLMGATVRAAFIKRDGSLRYMVCEPLPGVDGTARYYTVRDLEVTDRVCYRRINLDSVAAIAVEKRIAG